MKLSAGFAILAFIAVPIAHLEAADETPQGKQLASISGQGTGLLGIAVAPDGVTVFSTGGPDQVHAWNTTRQVYVGKVDKLKPSTGSSYHLLALHPKQPVLVASAARMIVLVSPDRRGVVGQLSLDRDTATSLALSPDGKQVAVGTADGDVRVWDFMTGKQVVSFKHNRDVRTITFSPDGKTLLTGSLDKSARLWDVAAGRQLRAMEEAAAEVCNVAFEPDGKHLWSVAPRNSSSSDPLVVRRYETETGKEVAKQEIPYIQDQGFCVTTAIMFLPECRRLLIGRQAGGISLWDVGEQKVIAHYVGHKDRVNCLAQSPTDKTVFLSGGHDGTLRVWKLP